MKGMVRIAVWGTVSIATLYTLVAMTAGVSLYRLVPIDNDPLTNSIAITSVSSNRLTLADGRVLVMLFSESEQLSRNMCESAGRVELESRDFRCADVYVKKKIFICGTHAPRIVIPLFENKYAANFRFALGVGEFQ